MAPPAPKNTDQEERDRNVAARTKLDLLWGEVKELKEKLLTHMENEDNERRVLDRKLFWLFILATGNLGTGVGPDLIAFVAKLFM